MPGAGHRHQRPKALLTEELDDQWQPVALQACECERTLQVQVVSPAWPGTPVGTLSDDMNEHGNILQYQERNWDSCELELQDQSYV